MKNKYLAFALAFFCFLFASNCKKTDTGEDSKVTIGQSYAGGIVFYVDASGKHGLVAATSDQEENNWEDCNFQSCGTLIAGASGTAVGTGAQNTLDIVAGYGANKLIAGTVCDKLNFAGYDDWFLPSKDELLLMYQHKDLIGGGKLSSDTYWSSSQASNNQAYVVDFSAGDAGKEYKVYNHSIRAVRAF